MGKTILFIGGGSIGHIAPSVAVWEAVQRLTKSSHPSMGALMGTKNNTIASERAYLPANENAHQDIKAHFVCSPRPDDAKFLGDNDLSYSILDAPRIGILFPFKLIGAIKRAKQILHEQKPDVIFSKGSYISLPLCIAAKKMSIPIILHDSDAVPGRANAIVSRWAIHICTGFPREQTNKRTNDVTYTGNPLRPNITEGSKEEALRITGFDGKRPILLVMGGSQGSLAINQAIEQQLDDLLLRCNIIHITGRNKSQVTSSESRVTNHYYQTEFANKELAHFYAAAEVALSRAGANAIAEFAANAIPTILVPLRGVGHDHQYKNTLVASEHGCIHLEQRDLDTDLLSLLHTILADNRKRQQMSMDMRTLSKPDAAVQIAKIIVQTLDSTQSHQ